MKLEIFSVKDNATAIFTRPFFMLTVAEATRQFTTEVNNPESQLHQHPHDFHLYHLGTFNQDTGQVTEKITDLGQAAEYLLDSLTQE